MKEKKKKPRFVVFYIAKEGNDPAGKHLESLDNNSDIKNNNHGITVDAGKDAETNGAVDGAAATAAEGVGGGN
jgi:hypothetical protein